MRPYGTRPLSLAASSIFYGLLIPEHALLVRPLSHHHHHHQSIFVGNRGWSPGQGQGTGGSLPARFWAAGYHSRSGDLREETVWKCFPSGQRRKTERFWANVLPSTWRNGHYRGHAPVVPVSIPKIAGNCCENHFSCFRFPALRLRLSFGSGWISPLTRWWTTRTETQNRPPPPRSWQ